MNTQKSFFLELFDFSFKSFITPKIIKLLYIIVIVAWSITGLVLLVSGIELINSLPGSGFFLMILAFLIPLVGIIYSRVILEIIIVFFDIGEKITEIAKTKQKETDIES